MKLLIYDGSRLPKNPTDDQLIAYLSFPNNLVYWSWAFDEILERKNDKSLIDLIDNCKNNEYAGLAYTLRPLDDKFHIDLNLLKNKYNLDQINREDYIALNIRLNFIDYRIKGENYNIFQYLFREVEDSPQTANLVFELLERKIVPSKDFKYLSYIESMKYSENIEINNLSQLVLSQMITEDY
jgi:hypothetical protein